MAEASAGSSDADLEQSILQALREAGAPVKTSQLVKTCQVTKKKLNQVLYRMEKQSQVARVGNAVWQLGGTGTGQPVSTELALPSSIVKRSQEVTTAILLKPGCQLSEQQEQIYRCLEDKGPLNALIIAQSLGMKRSKDVKSDLYALRNKHILNYDDNSRTWMLYQSGSGETRQQRPSVIFQQSPINMICQNAPNSHISIQNSEAIQIGHGNIIMTQPAPGDHGSSVPLGPPPPAPADPSTQDSLTGPWGSQDIYLEQTMLRRAQLGHGNEMNVYGPGAAGPNQGTPVSSLSVSPPASATTADPEAGFDILMPAPGSQPEGDRDIIQKVHIKSCFLEDAIIGHCNRMHIGLGTAGPGEGSGPEDSSGDPGEPAEGAAPPPEAAEPENTFSHSRGHADPDVAKIIAHLEAVTLDSRDPEATEDSA